MVLPILIGVIAIAALFVVVGLLFIIFAFLNPWAVVAMFGFVVAGAVYHYRLKKGRK